MPTARLAWHARLTIQPAEDVSGTTHHHSLQPRTVVLMAHQGPSDAGTLPQIRNLRPEDVDRYLELRLSALVESPTSFVATVEEEQALGVEERRSRIADTDNGFVVGAFDGSTLVAMAGVLRESRQKLSHKVMLWGVYVSPAWRGRGLGHALVAEALRRAASLPRIHKIYLGVNATNAAAIALYESLEFQAYGLDKSFMVVDGAPQDEIFMARPI